MTRNGGEPLKVILYSHEAYGLGHLKNTLTLTRYLRARRPGMRQLIVTGAAMPHGFVLPDDTDYIKLPSVTKLDADSYAPRSLPLTWDETWALRRDIILTTAQRVRPDALIADALPHGHRGELVATLRCLKESSPKTRLVLGLRDIVGDAGWVRPRWTRDGVYELLDDVYDLILVYGEQAVYDPIAEYGMSPKAAAKTRFVGYLRREALGGRPEEIRARLGLETERLVVVLAGGTGSRRLFLTALESMRQADARPFDCLVIGGPQMPSPDRAAVAAATALTPRARFVESVDEGAAYIAAADAVVSFGGYSSACEILSFSRPAVIVPDGDANGEQLIRAELLSARGLVRAIRLPELSPERLAAELSALLEGSDGVPRRPLALDGLPSIVAELDALLSERA